MLFHGQKLCTDLLACAISRVNQRLITFHFFSDLVGFKPSPPKKATRPSLVLVNAERQFALNASFYFQLDESGTALLLSNADDLTSSVQVPLQNVTKSPTKCGVICVNK